MWKYWPFRKDYLVYTGAVLLFFISYGLAFSRTLDEWHTYRELNQELAANNDLSYQPGYMERKSRNLERALALYHSDTASFRSNTLSQIAILAEKQHVRLTGVPAEQDIFHTDRAILQKLRFTGDFFSLNRFLYELESTRGIGLPRSVVYRTDRKVAPAASGTPVLEVLLEISK
ncbi:hypothetical protein [Mucilaginibacter sp. SG564]|uniref:hypothetical protein n=1 Tax=Mucilaginibacter sp. SG564 TaxID=2587022 RepID=UPI0015522FBD|nr:hypothetical protein [Mucilaginibacter sp. SG564]NOW98929.1 hypothetical protein [Mucilaginibacter sp. SG564]